MITFMKTGPYTPAQLEKLKGLHRGASLTGSPAHKSKARTAVVIALALIAIVAAAYWLFF